MMAEFGGGLFCRSHTDAIKGIAILFVMLGHTNIIPYAGAYGVVLFLMLSGFGLVQSYFATGLDGFFSKRLSKVLIPYTVITVIWLMALGHSAISSGDYYQLFTIVFGLDSKATLDPTMWYVTYVIIWYVAFYFIFSANSHHIIKILFLFLFSYYLYNNASIFTGDSGAGLYVTAFPIGAAWGMVFYKTKHYSINKKYLLSGCFVFSVAALYASINFYQNISAVFFDYAATNVSCALLVVGITSFLSILGVNFGVFEFFGKLSYEIYLIEGVFLMRFFGVLDVLPTHYMKVFAFIFIVTVAAYIFRLLLSFTMKNISKAASKWLLNNRAVN
ncbi:TPA: acyltransferase family protein [Aeromonas hydrophila]|uniref:acyltransferase family protein n=1 Tax=Aeromonas hydrophila TaxID=644 RepID=UPI0038D22256